MGGRCFSFTSVLMLSAATGLPAIAAAQSTRSIWDGVYTEGQAARGATQYGASCASCHAEDLRGNSNAPSLVGVSFMFLWENRSLGDLFTTIRTGMPTNAPNSLPAQGYLDILAYILGANEFPAGEDELGADLAALGQISITADAPTPVPPTAVAPAVVAPAVRSGSGRPVPAGTSTPAAAPRPAPSRDSRRRPPRARTVPRAGRARPEAAEPAVLPRNGPVPARGGPARRRPGLSPARTRPGRRPGPPRVPRPPGPPRSAPETRAPGRPRGFPPPYRGFDRISGTICGTFRLTRAVWKGYGPPVVRFEVVA